MTKCVAKGCTNTSNKLVKMNYFPKDPDKRQKWLKNCEELGGMDNWTPNKNAALCEFHFSKEMWEERNRKMKLTKNAVPTIFGDFVYQVKISIETDKIETINEPEMYIDLPQKDSSVSHPVSGINKIIIKPQVLPKVIGTTKMASYTEYEEITVDVHTPLVDSETSNTAIEISNLSLEQSIEDARKRKSQVPDEQSEQFIENLSTETVTSDYSDTELLNEEKNLTNLENEFSVHSSGSDISDKYKKLEKMYLKSEKLRRLMKANHKKKQGALKNRIKQLQAKACIIENSPKFVLKIFNIEQLALLNMEYKRMPKWCDSILVIAYQLKFACGVSGYKELLKQGFPLPSLRTLRKKLENWNFRSGDTNEVFQFLKIIASMFKSNLDKDCLIVINEISITPGVCYDNSTGSYIGNVTLPGHDYSELATHVLVIILAGIAQRWKQVVDFYYTSKSTDGKKYKPILLDIIKKAREVIYGLLV